MDSLRLGPRSLERQLAFTEKSDTSHNGHSDQEELSASGQEALATDVGVCTDVDKRPYGCSVFVGRIAGGTPTAEGSVFSLGSGLYQGQPMLAPGFQREYCDRVYVVSSLKVPRLSDVKPNLFHLRTPLY